MRRRGDAELPPEGGVARSVIAVLLALVVALVFVPAAPATITYQCGVNLCRVAGDGTGQAQITSDGTATSPYTWPSLSRDGSRMAWIRNGDLYLGSPAAQPTTGPITRSAIFAVIRPDGAQVGALENSYALVTGTYVKVFDATGARILSGPQPDNYSLGWAPDGSLLLPWSGTPKVGICVAADTGGSWQCVTRIADDPAGDLNYPAVSPDGKLLAVEDAGRIAVFDYAARTLVRYVTAGPGDTTPAWSPDSTRIAFQHGTGASTTELHVVGVDATGDRLLASGGAQTPTWGGPADTPAPVPAATPAPAAQMQRAAKGLVVARTQRGRTVRGRIVIVSAGSRLTARLTNGTGRLLGTLSRRGLRAGTLRFTIPLSRTGRSALRRTGALRLRLKVVVTAPGASSTLTAAVNLRR